MAHRDVVKKIARALLFIVILYLFFVCIEMMGSSFKLFGKDFAKNLFSVTDNPIVGLVIGILATSLMQSSSTTTSIVVGMVAVDTLTLTQAIPMVMGANIGTTITNTIVSLGHMRRKNEFRLAYTGAVVHDVFNFMAVTVLLPLEHYFHLIEKVATALAGALVGFGGASFDSPLKAIVKPVVELAIGGLEALISNPFVAGGILLAVALALLIFSLTQMVKIMRSAVFSKIESVVDKYIFKNWFVAIVFGVVITAIVQSSSVSTSIVVPMMGAGILTVEKAFPFMLGANIGTTITAILASFVTGSGVAVAVAFCHLIFNLIGTIMFLPLAKVPITIAKKLGDLVERSRAYPIVIMVGVFFVLPGLLLLIFR